MSIHVSDNVKDAVTGVGAIGVVALKDWLSIIIMLMTMALLYYRIKKARNETIADGDDRKRD